MSSLWWCHRALNKKMNFFFFYSPLCIFFVSPRQSDVYNEKEMDFPTRWGNCWPQDAAPSLRCNLNVLLFLIIWFCRAPNNIHHFDCCCQKWPLSGLVTSSIMQSTLISRATLETSSLSNAEISFSENQFFEILMIERGFWPKYLTVVYVIMMIFRRGGKNKETGKWQFTGGRERELSELMDLIILNKPPLHLNFYFSPI